jgi:hypothetical protein
LNYILNYALINIQDGYDELFAKEICGLNNPVVFNLLVTLHEAAQCDLNYFSDRDKIFRRFQNQKYVQGNFFDKQAFCDDHDISVEDLVEIPGILTPSYRRKQTPSFPE